MSVVVVEALVQEDAGQQLPEAGIIGLLIIAECAKICMAQTLSSVDID